MLLNLFQNYAEKSILMHGTQENESNENILHLMSVVHFTMSNTVRIRSYEKHNRSFSCIIFAIMFT